jgi:phytanoyl-CoA hydroxylase
MTTKTQTRLTVEQINFFHDQGYLIVEDIFDPADLRPLQQEIADAVDRELCKLHSAGKLTDLHQDEPFETRLAKIQEDSKDNAKTVIKALLGKSGGGMSGQEMFEIIRHPKLLDIIESLVGPEIIGSSVFRMRPKLPSYAGGVVPWHQDSGYLETFCDDKMIITCWVPLVNATVENGCMSILPRVHRKGIVKHYTGGNAGFLVIKDQDLPGTMDDAVAAPCPLGGVVLMTNLTPHCSTPNTTNHVRWSVDLRYQGASVPNNVAVPPEAILTDYENVTRACYPPEADFVVRSRRAPETEADFAAFLRRRDAWENAKMIPYPERGWEKLAKV